MRFIIGIAFYILFAGWASAETRLALVIHQQNYTGDLSPVELAESEADQIANALGYVGFDVTRASNLTKQGLDDALDAFRIKLERAGSEAIGFVYYTGHGAQSPRTRDSYLLGVNTRLSANSDLALYGVNLASQRDAFGAVGAKALFLVFDACRNTPAVPGFKADVKGLNRIEAAPEMLIAYSTSLGDLAEEGVYAPILAEEIRRDDQSAEEAFLNTQKRVAQQSGQVQRPWSNFLFYDDFCFSGCAPQSDLDHWQQLKTMGVSGAKAYLQIYPNGEFVDQARSQLAVDSLHTDGHTALDASNFEEALGLWSEACEMGEGKSCYDIGNIYVTGKPGIAKNMAVAIQYYKRSCDYIEAYGCSAYGYYSHLTFINASASSRASFLDFVRYGCRMGDSWGCDRLDKLGLSR